MRMIIVEQEKGGERAPAFCLMAFDCSFILLALVLQGIPSLDRTQS